MELLRLLKIYRRIVTLQEGHSCRTISSPTTPSFDVFAIAVKSLHSLSSDELVAMDAIFSVL